MHIRAKLLRIGQLAGIYYPSGKNARTAVVYGLGAPTVPDNGNIAISHVLKRKGIDLFVPDYYGFGRSDGIFTPENCIKTFLNIYELFKKGCIGISYYDLNKFNLHYEKVIFVGKSLAGAYVPLLPRFNTNIQELAIICPAADQSAQGEVKGEETNEDFMRSMEKDGYKYLYRGVVKNKRRWWKHLEDEDGLSPMDNISFLRDAKLFIAHGKKDTCIHYSKSVKYFDKILETLPDKKSQFTLKLYGDGDHGDSTVLPGVRDFLRWIS